ncbi:ribosome maturation factor [Carboxydothermus islandicus]|uniref:Ribosome maturation factor RimP n=1 Tax=Carboxydothermus islandicus TaxID=661089 RepID=A0A1L8D0A5_9THEO|nr:ribosome maturation factor RimP [Carboxydothermus islandicus]GAV24541.1 ribosome maturation factor [Carboxydothermus islandicus]
MGRNKGIEQKVWPLAERVGGELNLEVVDVEFVKEAGRYFLRIYIDKDEGVDLDDCQNFSERIGVILDEEDPIPQSYYLEVSSPGIERPLKKLADFEKFAGREAQIKTFAAIEGQKQFKGKLLGVRDGQVVIDAGNGEVQIPLEQIAKANLTFDF